MISIIVPVYNCEENLERCIQSIVNQSEPDIEIILVNDGSTDRSLKICNAYAKKDERIRVISQENGGVSKARNTGILAAKGTYLQFVDSDDYIHKDMCKILKKVMEVKEPDLIIAGFHHLYLGRDIVKCPDKEMHCKTKEEFGDYFLELYEQGFLNMPWNKLYKKEQVVELFLEDISLGEDLLFNLAYLKRADKVSMVCEPLYYYIQERGKANLSLGKGEDKLQLAKKFCQTVEEFYHHTLHRQGEEEIIYCRMISEFLCELAESVYDSTVTYSVFRNMAWRLSRDTYVKKVNHNIKNLPLDLKILNIFFGHEKIRLLWVFCHLRKVVVNLVQRKQLPAKEQ